MSASRRLFEHYLAYHADGPLRLRYMAYVGATGCVLFYFIRFTRPNPDLFDDLFLRALSLVLFAAVALPQAWPERARPYYFAFSYAVQLLCLPCFTLLVALQRGGGIPAVSNIFIMLGFLILSSDWRNTLVMLAAGTALATGIYVATSPHPVPPRDVMAQLPAYAYIVIGSSLFKASTDRVDTARKLRATRALAGSIAHEMRNPLAQLGQQLQAMLGWLPEPTTRPGDQALPARNADALYAHLAQGELAIRRGLQVISMTLDEVGARPPTIAASLLSAAQTAHRAVAEHGYENEEARQRVAVRVLEDFCFRGDETRCLFVLFNLLDNALAAVAADPAAGVTVTVGRHQIRVRDTGAGIAPFRMARLFEPFETAGKPNGTGLGLAYCQRAMRALGGSIRCDSVQGAYAEFILEFPPATPDAPPGLPGDGEPLHAALAGGRVIVVDDDALQRQALCELLQAQGIEVHAAADGEAALMRLAQDRYALVLLDLHMPGTDGYAVASRLRQGAAPASTGACVVARSSDASPGTRIKARKAGMDGFVAKSATAASLFKTLADTLERHAAAPRDKSLAGQTVLLADDNAASRRAMAATLAAAGARVLQAAHGGEVLAHILASPSTVPVLDAVLLDLQMPVLDGLETARAIRRSGAHTLPLVALTAREDLAAQEAAREAGIDAFFTKPLDVQALFRLIGRTRPKAAPAAAARADEGGSLLDIPRLQGYMRRDRLDEQLDDYLPEIRRLVGRLPALAARQDRAQCLDVLHSLLGMSGEAGALALHRAVRKVYRPLLEDETWPAQPGWPDALAVLADHSAQALREHARQPAPTQTPN